MSPFDHGTDTQAFGAADAVALARARLVAGFAPDAGRAAAPFRPAQWGGTQPASAAPVAPAPQEMPARPDPAAAHAAAIAAARAEGYAAGQAAGRAEGQAAGLAEGQAAGRAAALAEAEARAAAADAATAAMAAARDAFLSAAALLATPPAAAAQALEQAIAAAVLRLARDRIGAAIDALPAAHLSRIRAIAERAGQGLRPVTLRLPPADLAAISPHLAPDALPSGVTLTGDATLGRGDIDAAADGIVLRDILALAEGTAR